MPRALPHNLITHYYAANVSTKLNRTSLTAALS